MIVAGGHLGFFQNRHNVCMRCRHQNYDFMSVRTGDIVQIIFHGGHLKKLLKPIFRSNFYSGTIANIIPMSPLNKMVPLLESSGGGGGLHGDLF